jgi:hypothetical protein
LIFSGRFSESASTLRYSGCNANTDSELQEQKTKAGENFK